MNDSKVDPLTAAQQAVAGVEWGKGSEHFRYGRETMQADAISAIGALRGPGWTAELLRDWHIANLEAFLDLDPEDRRRVEVERPDLMKRLRDATQASLSGSEWGGGR